MNATENIFLVIPGLGGSGTEHWQSLWESKYENFQRIEQTNWNYPVCSQWIENIEKAVASNSSKNIFFVAHSLGCIAVANWAAQSKYKVVGALLVAPPDLEIIQLQNVVVGFNPVQLRQLLFQSILVASSNDKFANISKAWQYARFWGSQFVNIGNKGHINAESGFGDWPDGFKLLNQLVEKQFQIAI